jgi:hypothetical protein
VALTDWPIWQLRLFRKESKVDLHLHAFINWMVPALALWAVIGVQVFKEEAQRAAVDGLYFLAILLVGAMTWRTMSLNDPYWLIHTASLGMMIVAGVLPRRSSAEESVPFVA